MDFTQCLEKQEALAELFQDCSSAEQRYRKIMELGKLLEKVEDEERTEDNRVNGCQSRMYLVAKLEDGKLRFRGASDALISAGLAYLLINVYDNESPETVLKCDPDFLDRLGITGSISPSRANGLYSLHLSMKQEALKALTGRI